MQRSGTFVARHGMSLPHLPLLVSIFSHVIKFVAIAHG